MNPYRFNSVQLGPTGAIPLLVPCEPSQADGLVLPLRHHRLPKPAVRVIDLKALSLLRENRPAFERRYGSVPQAAMPQWWGVTLLTQALKDRNPKTWEMALQRLALDPWPELSKIKRRILEHQPGSELGQLFAEGLKGIEFVLWQREVGDDTEILPGLYCPNACAALYALAWFHYVEGAGAKGPGACPACGKIFTRKRSTRKFCSDSCRVAWYRNHPKKSRKPRKRRHA